MCINLLNLLGRAMVPSRYNITKVQVCNHHIRGQGKWAVDLKKKKKNQRTKYTDFTVIHFFLHYLFYTFFKTSLFFFPFTWPSIIYMGH